jgi:hypothetical protein
VNPVDVQIQISPSSHIIAITRRDRPYNNHGSTTYPHITIHSYMGCGQKGPVGTIDVSIFETRQPFYSGNIIPGDELIVFVGGEETDSIPITYKSRSTPLLTPGTIAAPGTSQHN